MRKITLLNNLQLPDSYHLKGEVVEVDQKTYDYLMMVYMEARRQEVKEMQDAEPKLRKAGLL